MREVFGSRLATGSSARITPAAAPARGRCRRAAARRPRAGRRAHRALCAQLDPRAGIRSAISTSLRGRAAAGSGSTSRSAMRPTSTFFSTDRRFTRLWCWKIMRDVAPERRRSRRSSVERHAVDARSRRRVGLRSSRLMQRSSVDLPAPRGPSTTRNSPGLHGQVDVLQSRASGVRLRQASGS